MVAGSMTVKSKSFIWPLLLCAGVGGILLFICLSRKEEEKACSSIPAAVIASNPNLARSYIIEKAKKKCLEERICSAQVWAGSYPCEFTVNDLKECRDIDPALADYKMAQRHLEAEVQTCELRKVKSTQGVTVYQWIEED